MSSPLSLADVVSQFPSPPDPTLDPILDAVGSCIERHGIRRTTMTDIARKAGIARSTLYQKVGSVDQAAVLYAVRELHVFLATQQLERPIQGPDDFATIIAGFVSWLIDHPALEHLADEPEFVTDLVINRAAGLDLVATMLTPALVRLREEGLVADRDPAAMAAWLVRVIAMLVLSPPVGDLADTIKDFVLPGLQPQRRGG